MALFYCPKEGDTMALKKLCSYSGCRELVDYGIQYCSKHKTVAEQEQKQNYIDYKARRTDIEEQKFYKSKEWIMLRDYIKGKYNGLCLHSYYIEGKIVAADVVHHIVEVKQDWNMRLDEDNLIPLSNAAHNLIHSMYKEDKEGTQKMLRDLISRFSKEFIIN